VTGARCGRLLLLAALAGCGHEAPPAQPPAPERTDLAADDRIAWLLAPCARADAFLADTGDSIAVLVSKLARSQLDPLRQAKTELVALGDAALPELRRFCQRNLDAPDGAAPLLNALAVVGAMETHGGHDLLLAGLGSGQDTIRLEAIQGLRRHATPEDYDRLMAIVPVASPDVQRALGPALWTADRDRFEDDFVAWLGGPREQPSLWVGAPERVATTKRPAILARMRELFPAAEGELRAYFGAALAAQGDPSPLAALRDDLKDDDIARRMLTARALTSVGLAAECAPRLWEDREETVRGFVARAIADLPPSPETSAWLRRGMLDRARSVRQACLEALARRGDAEARDSALAMFEGSRGDVEYAIGVLRGAWEGDAAFAARSFELLRRLQSEAAAAGRGDDTNLDRAIGMIPLTEAAAFLYERGRNRRGEVDHMPAHRWYLMQASNTGAVGRAWLRDRWAEEQNPAWRVDIAMACAADKNEASREFLLRIAEDERSTPLEILHAANLVAHHGPASIVAPRLKRVVLRVADERARPALNCLLWQWYGEGA